MKKPLIIIIAVAVIAVGIAIYYGVNNNSSPAAGISSPNTIALAEATSSKVVELKNGDTYTLAASYVVKTIAGRPQTMLAYNGSIPGPTIKVAQGTEVTINFKNNTDLSAALHSHGVRMDNQFDGAPGVTQKEIPPGQTFVYKLKFPDAGIFWYHPHVNEVYEQPLGLYGAFVVEPTDAAYYPPANEEVPLFLSDLPVENGTITLTKDTRDQTLMGHYGNVFLVNGQENFSLPAKVGEVVQLDVVNAANARPFNFAIPGVKLKIVGSDNGAYEKAFLADSIILGPSERAIVDVLFPKAGTYTMEDKTPNNAYPLGTVAVSADAAQPSYATAFNTLQENKTVEASIDPFRSSFSKSPDKQLKLTVDMSGHMMSMSGMGGHMMPNGSMMGGSMSGMAMSGTSSDGIEWDDDMQMMNQMSDADSVKWKLVDEATGKENTDINWKFNVGDKVKIRIYNDPNSAHPMQHPIHFHGQRFLVLDRNGVAQTDLVWKDTVLVPASQYVDILLDASNPGTWMAHCHTAEHLQSGMAMTFTVN